MHKIATIVLLFILAAFAEAHGSEDSMDKVGGTELADAMVDRSLNDVPAEELDCLDDTTVGKAGRLAASPTAVRPVASIRPMLPADRSLLSPRSPTFQSPGVVPSIIARPRQDTIVAQAKRKDCIRRVRTNERARAKNRRWKKAVREGRKYMKEMAIRDGYTPLLEIIGRKVQSNIDKAAKVGTFTKRKAGHLKQKIHMIRNPRNYPEEQVKAALPLLAEMDKNKTRNKEARIAVEKANIEKKKLAASKAAASGGKA